VVFNTEHLSSLFERVVIASGTSNRQTKALAASVRDGVREAGFAKPRIEGEDNGEWIIVDCGAVVVHIMQPAIRTYLPSRGNLGRKACTHQTCVLLNLWLKNLWLWQSLLSRKFL
jgi:ribosome silencing factor RsfS/YbeB/iojap